MSPTSYHCSTPRCVSRFATAKVLLFFDLASVSAQKMPKNSIFRHFLGQLQRETAIFWPIPRTGRAIQMMPSQARGVIGCVPPQGEAQADVITGERHRVEAAARHEAVFSVAAPTANPNHAVDARCGSHGIRLRITAIVAPPVVAPLEHVPAHVVQAKLVRRFRGHRVRAEVRTAAAHIVALSSYHATSPSVLLPEYLKPRLLFPPRAAYFHSASVGKRNVSPVSTFSFAINVWQSSQLTRSTGRYRFVP